MIRPRPEARLRTVKSFRPLLRRRADGFSLTAVEVWVPDDVKVALHIFFVILVLGTGWRLLSLHLVAAQNVHLQHAGRAMAFQY